MSHRVKRNMLSGVLSAFNALIYCFILLFGPSEFSRGVALFCVVIWTWCAELHLQIVPYIYDRIRLYKEKKERRREYQRFVGDVKQGRVRDFENRARKVVK